MNGNAANVLVIDGSVMQLPETRLSPAGIPISRFPIEHQSQCQEAGMPRAVHLRLGAVVTGRELQAAIGELRIGTRVRLQGFLARTGYRSEDYRLVLHAQSIHILNDADR